MVPLRNFSRRVYRNVPKEEKEKERASHPQSLSLSLSFSLTSCGKILTGKHFGQLALAIKVNFSPDKFVKVEKESPQNILVIFWFCSWTGSQVVKNF